MVRNARVPIRCQPGTCGSNRGRVGYRSAMTTAPGTLADLVVTDFSDSAAAAWCSRLLADFGATVVMVEPPGGHPLRREPPFDDRGDSVAAAYFLANKRSVILDLEQEGGRQRALQLARRSDVVINSLPPSRLQERGLTYGQIDRRGLVMAHVTMHGMSGPLAEVPGDELTVAARSGWAGINGDINREPLRPSGHQVAFCTGVAAYAAVVAAILHRDRHPGEGQEVDVSALDVMVSTFAPALLRAGYTGKSLGRREGADITAGPVPVADGHFALTISRAHFWRDAMHVLGLDDLAEDPRWETSWYRAAHKEEYVDRVQEAMAGWPKHELFRELAARRVVAGPVLTMAELVENEHLRERGFWVEAPGGERFPGPPFRMSRSPWALRSPAPRPGEHEREVWG